MLTNKLSRIFIIGIAMIAMATVFTSCEERNSPSEPPTEYWAPRK